MYDNGNLTWAGHIIAVVCCIVKMSDKLAKRMLSALEDLARSIYARNPETYGSMS